MNERERMDEKELTSLDALRRAANHIAAGRIYLRDNPLLRAPTR